MNAEATIVNLYYDDLAAAVQFWRDDLGFPVAVDQGWAKLFRLSGRSFLGLVDGRRGHLRPQPRSAVLVTLVVDDLAAWRERAQQARASGVTAIERREDLGIERFFCRDPGGYELEFQRFLRPEEGRIFHRAQGEAGAEEGKVPEQKESRMKEALKRHLEVLGGEVEERGAVIEFTKVLAERRAFLSRKKLVYLARLRVDEKRRELHLTESLTETGRGLAAESGVGFKAETYRTGRGPREGGIAEQSKLFGKVYAYTFDFAAVRGAIERLAHQCGYTVQYCVTGP